MDLDRAVLAHSQWKKRLKDHINGQGQIEAAVLAQLGKDDQCELGVWLYGEGRKHIGLAAFTDLKDKHAKFHISAASVVRGAHTLSQGQALELIDPFKSEFGRASSDVINAISTLKAAVK